MRNVRNGVRSTQRQLKVLHNMSRTIEHLTPIARGGRHDLDNIDFAHYGCNAQKQDRTLEEYREWRERVA